MTAILLLLFTNILVESSGLKVVFSGQRLAASSLSALVIWPGAFSCLLLRWRIFAAARHTRTHTCTVDEAKIARIRKQLRSVVWKMHTIANWVSSERPTFGRGLCFVRNSSIGVEGSKKNSSFHNQQKRPLSPTLCFCPQISVPLFLSLTRIKSTHAGIHMRRNNGEKKSSAARVNDAEKRWLWSWLKIHKTYDEKQQFLEQTLSMADSVDVLWI